MTLIRSFVFNLLFYVIMGLMGLLCLPLALLWKGGAHWANSTFRAIMLFLLRIICGLRVEVRGNPPTGEAIVAAKHQSFLDIFMIHGALPWPRFVMKRELTKAPVFGWYVMRAGSVPVDRGAGGKAIASMLAKLKDGRQKDGQIVIYPQGTRVAPGDKKPYKIGVARIYDGFGAPCYPVATNAGLFWGRHTFLRKPGVAIVEFLDPIPPGLGTEAFMETLEERIEAASDRLVAEARDAKTAK